LTLKCVRNCVVVVVFAVVIVFVIVVVIVVVVIHSSCISGFIVIINISVNAGRIGVLVIALGVIAHCTSGVRCFISNESVWGFSFANIGVGDHGQS